METPHLALGGVGQLVTLLDAARADGTADVLVSCGNSVIELSFADGRVIAEAGRDASKVIAASPREEAVLLIMGWRRDEGRSPFRREWHPNTISHDIVADIIRTARNAYDCEPDELHLVLRMTERASVTSRSR